MMPVRLTNYAQRCSALGKTPDEIRRQVRDVLLTAHNKQVRRCRSDMCEEAMWAQHDRDEERRLCGQNAAGIP